MKTTFDITKLWHRKAKQHGHKTKTSNLAHIKSQTVKESWDMSPEDALRVPYSGHK